MKVYRFTATLTKRPFTRTYKGSVRVLGNALDALLFARQLIQEKEDGVLDDGTSLKITISPSRKSA